jgi:diguanylate cyclase (GGDEF)-like protein/PAS domain S-box-containing protein
MHPSEDLSAQLTAEKALAFERTRLKNIIDGTGAGTWEWNVITGDVVFNEKGAELTGYSLSQLGSRLDERWEDAIHPDDRAIWQKKLQDHFDGLTSNFVLEMRVRHKDGHWVWVLDRGAIATWASNGEPEWMFGTRLDISERKTNEEKLRKNERFLMRVGNAAGVGGWEVDLLSGDIVWSKETFAIHGVPLDYRPDMATALDFYPPEARSVIEAVISRSIVTGEGWDLELPFIRRDGQRPWVRTVGDVEVSDGVAVRIAGAFQDISDRHRQRIRLEDANERMALAADSGGIGISDIDVLTQIAKWDPWMYRLYGLPADTPGTAEQLRSRAVHPGDLERVERSIGVALETRGDIEEDYRISWPDGSIHHLRTCARFVPSNGEKPARLIGATWDVTRQHRMAAEMAEQAELLSVTLHSIADAVVTTDASGKVRWLNTAAERLTGWKANEALGQPIARVFQIVNEKTRAPAPDTVTACLQHLNSIKLTEPTILISRDGREFGIEESVAPIRSGDGQTLGAVLVFHDVSEQRRLSREMRFRAQHDALTGLINRSEFDNRLDQTFDAWQKEGLESALLFIDLDQFKLVNDACGHAQGDELLRQVGRLIRETVREDDIVARLGGDEFALILKDCSLERAEPIAQQICNKMNDFRFIVGERRFCIGTSIGLVPIDGRFPNVSAIIQAADAYCYAAKRAGRNRIHLWNDDDQATKLNALEMGWASRIEEALDTDQFVLFAQKIKSNTGSNQALHLEILLRMNETDNRLVLPAAFIAAAERFKLASRIDRWVLKRTLEWLRQQSHLAEIDTIGVNLSGQSVGDPEFLLHAVALLHAAGRDVASRLCFEITETSAVTNLADAVRFLEQVRYLGVRVALDDFGAGASSFGYLKSFPVDYLKIDGQFVKNIANDPLNAVTVQCFVNVAKVIGIKTIAEFVDSEETLAFLTEAGVDYSQGYLVHEPVPLSTIEYGPATASHDLNDDRSRSYNHSRK